MFHVGLSVKQSFNSYANQVEPTTVYGGNNCSVSSKLMWKNVNHNEIHMYLLMSDEVGESMMVAFLESHSNDAYLEIPLFFKQYFFLH